MMMAKKIVFLIRSPIKIPCKVFLIDFALFSFQLFVLTSLEIIILTEDSTCIHPS